MDLMLKLTSDSSPETLGLETRLDPVTREKDWCDWLVAATLEA